MVGREDVADPVTRAGRPLAVLRRDLGGDEELAARVRPDELAEEPVGVAVAVDERGVEEGDPGVDRGLEDGHRLPVVGAGPAADAAAHPPHADAELAHGPAGPPEGSVLDHASIMRDRVAACRPSSRHGVAQRRRPGAAGERRVREDLRPYRPLARRHETPAQGRVPRRVDRHVAPGGGSPGAGLPSEDGEADDGRLPAGASGRTVALNVTVVPWSIVPAGIDERSLIVG